MGPSEGFDSCRTEDLRHWFCQAKDRKLPGTMQSGCTVGVQAHPKSSPCTAVAPCHRGALSSFNVPSVPSTEKIEHQAYFIGDMLKVILRITIGYMLM